MEVETFDVRAMTQPGNCGNGQEACGAIGQVV